jgi:uncharacterized protein YciI
MLFFILCTDKPHHGALRAATRPAHLAHIQPLVDTGRLIIAGPIPSEASPDPSVAIEGSLIVAEFDTQTDAETWAANDPYALAGLFESVSVRPYRKALP